jgi:dipeptidyl aminopeptidase/acylaminoacyl peptidase
MKSSPWPSLRRARAISLPAGKARTVLGPLEDDAGFITWTNGGNEIEFWKTGGQPLRAALTLESSAALRAVAACARGGLIAAANNARRVTFHTLSDGRRRHTATLPWNILRIQFSPDGALLAAFNWPYNFAILRTATGEIVSRWQVPGSEVGPFIFSPDGSLMALGGTDNLVSIYHTATGQRLTTLRGHKSDIKSAAFSPDGRTLATSSDSRTLKLWHVPTWRELATLSRDGVFSFLQFSPANDSLHAWDYDKNLHRFTAPRD